MRSILGPTKQVALVLLAIAAIATFGVELSVLYKLPSLLNAIDRGKQKQTIATMIQIGDELERFKRTAGHYPSPAV